MSGTQQATQQVTNDDGAATMEQKVRAESLLFLVIQGRNVRSYESFVDDDLTTWPRQWRDLQADCLSLEERKKGMTQSEYYDAFICLFEAFYDTGMKRVKSHGQKNKRKSKSVSMNKLITNQRRRTMATVLRMRKKLEERKKGGD
jgi:hypothetical protein